MKKVTILLLSFFIVAMLAGCVESNIQESTPTVTPTATPTAIPRATITSKMVPDIGKIERNDLGQRTYTKLTPEEAQELREVQDECPDCHHDYPYEKIIVEIEGESTKGITLPKAVKKLKGPKGTKVKLRIARRGESRRIEKTVERDTINPSAIINPVTICDEGKISNSIWPPRDEPGDVKRGNEFSVALNRCPKCCMASSSSAKGRLCNRSVP